MTLYGVNDKTTSLTCLCFHRAVTNIFFYKSCHILISFAIIIALHGADNEAMSLINTQSNTWSNVDVSGCLHE